MKNTKIRKLEKYESENYSEIGFGVFLNKLKNKYCFSYETILEDGEGQYPLEDLLDKYGVNCTEYYGQEEIINGERVSYVEVETLSSTLKDLISILNYATIVDKVVQSVAIKGRMYIVKKYSEGNVMLNDIEYTVPIIADRSANRELNNFEIKYPEKQYEAMFLKGVKINEVLENYAPKYILLGNGRAKIICEPTNFEEIRKNNEHISQYQIGFFIDLKGNISKENV